MLKFLFFIVGLMLVITSNLLFISYLNLLTIGYNFSEYVKFIISGIEFYLLLIGYVLLFFSIRGGKNELHI